MAILDYSYIKQQLNKKLFKDSYSDLFRKIAENPERYIGLFRPTKPKTKLIQNITQSHEIRFGDALEFLFERYFEALGFSILNTQDLCVFLHNKSLYLYEVKLYKRSS